MTGPTPNDLILLLTQARNALRTNSGALVIIGRSLDIMEDVRPGLVANAALDDEITDAINRYYDETQPGS